MVLVGTSMRVVKTRMRVTGFERFYVWQLSEILTTEVGVWKRYKYRCADEHWVGLVALGSIARSPGQRFPVVA